MLQIHAQKRFGSFCLNANFSVKRGDFVALFGKSGSGKTTILRLLAGFERASSGEASFLGREFFSEKSFLPPQKRGVGYLFQDYALFPNMSVLQNLLFAKKDKNRAFELLEFVEMREFANANVTSLSGGQKQRVALVRALMSSPELLLLDEPFSALDGEMKAKLRELLREIHRRFSPTILLVTHDKEDVLTLCSKVFFVENGEVRGESVSALKTAKKSNLVRHHTRGEILKKAIAFCSENETRKAENGIL